MVTTTTKKKQLTKSKSVSKNNKSIYYYLAQAKKIFDTIEIETELKNENTQYYITSTKYNEELCNNNYNITHFLIYCMLRFNNTKFKDIITHYIQIPIAFPLNNTKKQSFNKCMNLCNFIYYLLEYNFTLNEILKYSSHKKIWKYNLTIDKQFNKYNLFYIIPSQNIKTIKITAYSTYQLNNTKTYVELILNFIKTNYIILKDNKLTSNILDFYQTHKLNYKDKYLYIDGYYIPRCHYNIDEELKKNVIQTLLYKEIAYPTESIIKAAAYVLEKYRNIKQLEHDLNIANITKHDFNDMITCKKPLIFKSNNQYRNFIKDITKIILTKFKNFTLLCYGSSTTFYSLTPRPHKIDTFLNENSDIDLKLIINENFDHYKAQLDSLSNSNNVDLRFVYPNIILRLFFDEPLMHKFFNKWGPQDFGVEEDYNKFQYIDKNKTILKRNVSIVLSIQSNIYDFENIIKDNKTLFPNYTTFVRNGKTLSYWNEHNEYITENI